MNLKLKKCNICGHHIDDHVNSDLVIRNEVYSERVPAKGLIKQYGGGNMSLEGAMIGSSHAGALFWRRRRVGGWERAGGECERAAGGGERVPGEWEGAAGGWERDTQAPRSYNCLRCCHGGLMERQEFHEWQVLGNLDVVGVAP